MFNVLSLTEDIPKDIDKKDREYLFVLKYIGIAKYFFNKHEIFGYINTLEYKLKTILKDAKPNYRDIKYEYIINLLKKENVWKNYFNFGKFILYIDNIDDELLEKCYTYICEQKEDVIKFDNEQFKLMKKAMQEGLTYKREKYKVKSAKEIRKECKDIWNRFKIEFDAEFMSIYTETILQNDKRIF